MIIVNALIDSGPTQANIDTWLKEHRTKDELKQHATYTMSSDVRKYKRESDLKISFVMAKVTLKAIIGG